MYICVKHFANKILTISTKSYLLLIVELVQFCTISYKVFHGYIICTIKVIIVFVGEGA